MTYPQIIEILKSNHFYPATYVEVGTKKILGLRVDAAPITMDDKAARIREVLKENGIKAKVDTDKNKGLILIEKK